MNSASVFLAILASAVIVLGGLVTAARAMFRAASELRDNKHATKENTIAISRLSAQMDERMAGFDNRITALERGK